MSALRSLHLCNLANVAYGYCKILEQAGDAVELRCHDLRHLMSQPEWDDLELEAEDFPDEWDFYSNTADFGDYRRPSWYRAVGIRPGGIVELGAEAAAGAAEPGVAERTRGGLANAARRALARLPPPLARRLKWRIKSSLVAYQALRSDEPFLETYRSYTAIARRFGALVAESESYGPDFAVDRDMLANFQRHAWWARQQYADCDVVFSYVLAPIYVMLLGDKPSVSVEIGTMRDLPFDGSDLGRLLALAYRLSSHVLITNPDVKRQADRLGLESYAFCPHPLDEEVYRPAPDSELRRALVAETGAEHLLFAPARQNWEIKRNDRYLEAHRRLVHDDGLRALLIIPGWGQEVERSRALCRELGTERWVRWIPPQSEKLLVQYYRAADFVLDQFGLGVFGLITPKAMSCGAVVVTSYEPELHQWCFPEHPPLVAATRTEEIRRAIRELCGDAERRREIGARARRWVLDHHSKGRIRKILAEAMAIARERHAARCG